MRPEPEMDLTAAAERCLLRVRGASAQDRVQDPNSLPNAASQAAMAAASSASSRLGCPGSPSVAASARVLTSFDFYY